MGYTLLSLGEIIFGLLAWGFPVYAIKSFQKKQLIKGTYSIFGSFVSASLSLLFVLIDRNHLIEINDWGALLDTARGFQFVSIFMIAVTAALNGVALSIMKENKN